MTALPASGSYRDPDTQRREDTTRAERKNLGSAEAMNMEGADASFPHPCGQARRTSRPRPRTTPRVTPQDKQNTAHNLAHHAFDGRSSCPAQRRRLSSTPRLGNAHPMKIEK
jgi:hypothetical protein